MGRGEPTASLVWAVPAGLQGWWPQCWWEGAKDSWGSHLLQCLWDASPEYLMNWFFLNTSQDNASEGARIFTASTHYELSCILVLFLTKVMFRIWNILNLGLFEIFLMFLIMNSVRQISLKLEPGYPQLLPLPWALPLHFQLGTTVSHSAASDCTMWAELIYPSTMISEQKIVLS